LDACYRSAAHITGADVIVDSSKRPSDGALLRLVQGVSPYYVHLVRDPRAVAFSRQRRKPQLDRDRPVQLDQHGPVDSTVSWLGWNLAAESLRRRHDRNRSLRVRYEDFVHDPRRVLTAITNLVEASSRTIPIEGPRTALLAPNHTVSGNPNRFTTGAVELREDTEWIASQRRVHRLAVTALALPLLRRYGYPVMVRSADR